MKVGDVVRLRPGITNVLGADFEERKYGIVLDAYEDDYGIVFFEVHWKKEIGWWSEYELEVISEAS